MMFAQVLRLVTYVRGRAMFSKSSVFTVVALVAFVSLGALLLPQVAQAQGWCCGADLGSDPLDSSVTNSPGDFSVLYCLDQPCLANLGVTFPSSPLPYALVQQTQGSSCGAVTISGTVIAVLKNNKTGVIAQDSAAEADFFVKVLSPQCDTINSTTLSRVIGVGEDPANVFSRVSTAPASRITILGTPANINNQNQSLNLPAKGWGGPGCLTDPTTGQLTGPCSFPLGMVQFNGPGA